MILQVKQKIAFLIVLIFLGACRSTPPSHGEASLNGMGFAESQLFKAQKTNSASHGHVIQTEYDIGFQALEIVLQRYTEVKDFALIRRIRQITKRLVSVADQRAGITINVTVLNTLIKDARAYPGGFITVTKGLIDLAKTDDELAVIIGHEIAHEMRGFLSELPQKLLERVPKETRSWGIQFIKGEGFKEDFFNALAKDNELEADRLGLLWTSLAGYDIRQAETIFKKILTEDKVTTHPHLEERILRIRQEIEKMLDQLEIFDAGVRFYYRGRPSDAISAFIRFLSIYPSREVYINLGASYYMDAMGLLPENPPLLKCATDIEPEIRALSFRADRETLSQEDKAHIAYSLEQAEAFYRRALEISPEDPLTHNNLGCIYIALGGRPDDANIHFHKAIQIGGRNEARNNLGVLALQNEKGEEAITYFKNALLFDEKYADPYYNLGVIYKKAGMESKAKEAFTAYLSLIPNDKMGRWERVANQALNRSEDREETRQLPQAISDLLPVKIGSTTAEVRHLMRGHDREIQIAADKSILIYEQQKLKIVVRNGKVSEIISHEPFPYKRNSQSFITGRTYRQSNTFSHEINFTYAPSFYMIFKGNRQNGFPSSWGIFNDG